MNIITRSKSTEFTMAHEGGIFKKIRLFFSHFQTTEFSKTDLGDKIDRDITKKAALEFINKYRKAFESLANK